MASFTFNLESSLIEGSNTETFPAVTFTDTSINHYAKKDITIAAGAVDSPISLDGLTGKHVRVVFSTAVTVKLNGAAIGLTPSANNPASFTITGGAITSLTVSNPGTSPAECKLILMAEV